jgi:hypothetical protein
VELLNNQKYKLMRTMKKYAMGGSMTTTVETTKKLVKKTSKKPVQKPVQKPAQSKKSNEQNWGGEMGTAPFTTKENTERRRSLGLPTSKDEEKAYYEKMRREEEVISRSKNGKTMKKAKNGTSLGMKSVKAGFDKNPGVTRADIITAAKGKAKSGAKLKKQAATAIAMKKAGKTPKAMMKAGGKMTKCKYGCK